MSDESNNNCSPLFNTGKRCRIKPNEKIYTLVYSELGSGPVVNHSKGNKIGEVYNWVRKKVWSIK